MLPEGWAIQTLESLASVKRGKFTPRPRNDPRYYGGQMPFVQTGDVTSAGKYLTEFSQTLNDEGVGVSKVFPPNSILITIAANIGHTAITTFDVACPDSVVGIQPIEDRCDVLWLKDVLETKREELDGLSTQNAQKNINLEVLKPLSIVTPPLPEQRKIAEILSTWDAAIGAQEQLIANARAQKKALMQTLLPTGAHPPKKRLPGFSGEWRSVCLGDIGKLRKGKGIQRDQVRAMGFPCIRYGEIYTQHHEQVRQFHSFIDAETASESEPISAGDILFTCSGETAEEIGKCVAYLGREKAYAGGDIIILSPTADNAAFLGYVLNDTDVAEQKRRFGQGNSVVHISAANLSKLTFRLPRRPEQDAIASVLDDATIHIDGLAVELAVLRQEKSALMQQLLTGKRRVKVREAA